MRGSDHGATNRIDGDDQAHRTSEYPPTVDDLTHPEGVISWFGEVPDHGAVAHGAAAASSDVVLAVRPVAIQPPPAPPEAARPWLVEPLDDPTSPPEVHAALAASVTDPTEERPPPPDLLDAHPEIRDEIDLWLPFWHLWALAERHDRPARALHQRLRQAHELLAQERSDVELVMGVGLLSWAAPSGAVIRRHLVTAPVATELDAVTGEVRAVASTGDLAVELDMVDAAGILDQTAVDQVVAWSKDYQGALADREAVEEMVRLLAVSLHGTATYRPTDERPEPGTAPVVTWAPALVARKRNIVIDLRETEPAPEPAPVPTSSPERRPSGFTFFDAEPPGVDASGADADSPEVEIEPEAEPDAAVGYFDDQQPSTVEDLLVEVSAAAAELADPQTFPPIEEPWAPLEPLGTAEHDAVVGSMREAAEETRGHTAPELDEHQEREARQEALLDTLASLRRERALIRKDLAAARSADAPPNLLPYEGSRARVAERLAAEAPAYAWIAPGRVHPGSSPPVSDAHLRHWVALRSDPNILADQDLATGELLAIHRLPTVSAFQSVIDDEERAHQKADSYGVSTTAMAEAVGGLSETLAVSMRAHVVDISAALGSVDITNHRWAADALREIRAGDAEPWLRRRAAVTALVSQAEELLASIDPNTSIKCAGPLTEYEQQAVALREWLAGGNDVKITDEGKPKKRIRVPRVVADSAGLLERVRVNGAPPSSTADLDAFLAWARAGARVNQLEDAWPSPVNLDGSESVRVRLDRHRVALAELDRLLMVRDKLTTLDAQFEAHGVRGVSFDDPSSVALFLEELDRAAAHHRAASASELVLRGERRVQPFLALDDPPDWAVAFSHAVRTRDALAYQQVRERVQYLNGLRENLHWCEGIESRLRPALGSIIDTVSDPDLSDEWARRVDDFAAAWRWVGAKAWLEEGEVLMRRVADELRLVDERIERTIARLWSLMGNTAESTEGQQARIDELTSELREVHSELDRLRTENAVLRQLGDMVPEPPRDLDDH